MIVKLSGTLLRFVGYKKEHIIGEARTITAALDSLTTTYPTLKSILYDTHGSVRGAHQLFLNGEQLLPEDMKRQLQETDCLEILTAIAGG
ncbi:MAG: MoaD/ThiS family protein [Pseudomonadota bacterium]|nr:MoaD/ThiS family protein [Pseudomonadota bacterium]